MICPFLGGMTFSVLLLPAVVLAVGEVLFGLDGDVEQHLVISTKTMLFIHTKLITQTIFSVAAIYAFVRRLAMEEGWELWPDLSKVLIQEPAGLRSHKRDFTLMKSSIPKGYDIV